MNPLLVPGVCVGWKTHLKPCFETFGHNLKRGDAFHVFGHFWVLCFVLNMNLNWILDLDFFVLVMVSALKFQLYFYLRDLILGVDLILCLDHVLDLG